MSRTPANVLARASLLALGLMASLGFRAGRRDTGPGDGRAGPAEAAVFAASGPQLPHPALLRRHAPAHVVLLRCRRLRGPAHAAGRLSLRQGRGGHGVQRPAGEARPSARLPRRRRPRREHGLLPATVRRQARDARRSDGPALVRPDPVRQGRRGRPRDDHERLAGHVPPRHLLSARHAGLSVRPGRRRSRRRTRRTIPGRFTAFIGYEWTSNTGGNNLHRNVIFRDSGDEGEPGRAVHEHQALGQRRSPRPVEVDGRLRGEDRRRRARHCPQRQSQQRPHVPDDRVLHRQASGPRVCRDAGALGAALRGDPDEGRRRDAPVPVAQRRVRQLRALGQGQPRPERAQEAGDAPVRVCPLGAEARAQAGAGARHQSLQVRHDRLDRRPHRVSPPPTRTISSARPPPWSPAPSASASLSSRPRRRRSRTGRRRRRAMRPCGQRRTPARRCSTRCSGARPTPRPARA